MMKFERASGPLVQGSGMLIQQHNHCTISIQPTINTSDPEPFPKPLTVSASSLLLL